MGRKKTRNIVRTLVQLAKTLGVTRQALDSWRKMEGAPKPEPNGGHCVDAWEKFREKHKLKGHETPDEKAVKLEKLRVDLDRAKFNFEKDKGLYVHREICSNRMQTHLAELFKELSRRFEHSLPPQYTGKTAAEISAINRAELGE
ncbi:MAG: hypothetical protein AAFX93_19710, partial [Verrucomicrobiota bacterium]